MLFCSKAIQWRLVIIFQYRSICDVWGDATWLMPTSWCKQVQVGIYSCTFLYALMVHGLTFVRSLLCFCFRTIFKVCFSFYDTFAQSNASHRAFMFQILARLLQTNLNWLMVDSCGNECITHRNYCNCVDRGPCQRGPFGVTHDAVWEVQWPANWSSLGAATVAMRWQATD